MASVPALSNDQKSATSAAPGNRHAKPTRATGKGRPRALLSVGMSGDAPRSLPCGPTLIRRAPAPVLRTDRNSEVINLMQDKHYSNSAVDLCYMLVTTPPGSPRMQLID